MHRKLSWFVIISTALVCLVAPRGDYFSQSLQNRIVGPIAGSPVVWLEGNRRPVFQPENDTGPAPDSLRLENITLVFKPTVDQQANLASLLDEQQDRSSPLYHHWLTPEEFADQFGLSPTDLAAAAAWIQSQGFTVTQTARSRLWISFSGTAAQVQSAFHTEIHNYTLREKTYYGNASEPAVPAALAEVVLGIRGLDNYALKPRGIFRRVKAPLHPEFTSSVTGNTYVAPGDFAVIYDVNNLYSAGIDGTGQTIAVMGQTDLYNSGSDVSAFRSAAGLTGGSLTLKLIPGVSDPGVSSGDIEEASLDVEWSGAVAEHATILYVYANPNVGNGVFDAFSYAIDQNLAPVISISYGECEAAWPSGDLKVLAELGQQANVQGQTVVAAAGDSGAADCDVSSSPTSPVTIASHGLAVDAPASSPYTTGMGGSEFNEGSGSYWQTSTGSDILTSALSYIPEMAWNDTFSPENTDSELSAGGGGVSTYFTTKPSWQTGTGVPNDGARDVPDLSLNSSPAHDPLLICVEGSCVNGFRNTDQTLTVVGGTSAAAPTFAGIVALINQQMNTPMGQGNVDYALYPLAANSPAGFHDITVGNNIVPCESGSPDCPASNKMGYSAGVGYDQATGLGSVDAYNLVMAWGSSGAGNLPAPTLSAPANGATGVALSPSFNWTAVSGNAGYRIMIASSAAVLPTNPTTITCSSCVVPPATTATNTTSYTPSSPLAAGTYYWEVQAIGTGQGAWSNISSFITTGATLPAPALTTPATGATAVSLPPAFTWSAVTGNAGYRILVSLYQSALPTNPSVGTCGGCTVGVTTTTASYTPSATALNAGTPYYWEVQALSSSSGVYGTWSNISSFTTALAAPTLSAPANGATSVSLPPSFTWSTVAGNSGYQILVSTTQSALPTTASVGTCGGCSIGVTTSGASYTPAASALAGGTTYYWEVQALSSTSGVYGTWSSISTFATGATDFSLSASPSSVTVAPGGSGTSTLTLAPVNNFSATPTFTCAASSALVGVTCSVGTFSATNNTATVTITASSTAISYPALPRNPPFGGWWAVGLALLALLLLALGRWQDAARFVGASGPRPGPNAIRPYGGTISAALPYLRQMAFGAMLAALLLAALSCGGGSSSGGGGGGQTVSPPESGTVTVTGTSTVTGTTTTLTHTATISVSVS